MKERGMSPAVMPVFKNEHVSVSRLKRYEQCPRSFFYKYVVKGPEEPPAEAPQFGVILHRTLELLYGWVVDEEFSGHIPIEKLLEFYRQAWTESRLVGIALYNEGLSILRAYLQTHSLVNSYDILATEKEFNVELGPFILNGYIDRVDKFGDGWIGIIDFKSNRQLFTPWELENDLQLSLYALVARQMYPWANRFSFVFHMLRHNVLQGTERSVQQIENAEKYAIALGKRTETDKEFHAKLNSNCQYCESRGRCDRYQKAISEKTNFARISDLQGLDEIAAERERVAKIANAAYGRKKELDELIKARLEVVGEFDTTEGMHYRMVQPMNTSYDTLGLIELFVKAGVDRDRVLRTIMDVGVGKVEELRLELTKTMDRDKAQFFKVHLEMLDTKVAGTPRIDARKNK
jgi:ATP-dependent helicase/DNAse subunit B